MLIIVDAHPIFSAIIGTEYTRNCTDVEGDANYGRSLDLYEKMGQNFASYGAGELEGLAFCSYRLGKREKAFPYSQHA